MDARLPMDDNLVNQTSVNDSVGSAGVLFLASATALFLELALIRFLPGMIRVVSYFTNLVLLASFLGLGVGNLMARRRALLAWSPLALAAIVVLAAWFHGHVVLPTSAQTASEFFWLDYGAQNAGQKSVALVPILMMVFVAVTAAFVPLGQVIGRELRVLAAVKGYTVDIFGSLSGSLLFAAGSALILPPTAWMATVSVGLVILLALLVSARAAVSGALTCVVVVAAVCWLGLGSVWSPYYRIQIGEEEKGGTNIIVNQIFHQSMVDFSDASRAESGQVDRLYRKFALPSTIVHPRNVLVLGAGTGNDVAVALSEGAERVVAVEIDPVIQKIGERLNTSKPYQDPRVEVVIGDGRAFLGRSTESFDLIIFATLDSHTQMGGLGSLRLDNFIYTVECFHAARERLADDGVLVLNFQVGKTWIFERFCALVTTVFGEDAVFVEWQDKHLFGYSFIAGENVRQRFRIPGVQNVPTVYGVEIPSDDWPFLYLHARSIPRHSLAMIAFILVLGLSLPALAVQRQRLSSDNISQLLAFFFLGAGFLLIETRGVTEFALLYGSTWVVNVVVFTIIFVVILAANFTEHIRRPSSSTAILGALVVAILLGWIVPSTTLVGLNSVARTIAAGVLVGAPIYFAGLLFIGFFRGAKHRDLCFGANLTGAMVGGCLEFSSVIVGFRALAGIAIIVYLLAWMCASRGGLIRRE